MIAVEKLHAISNNYKRPKSVRAIFVEKDAASFALLKKAAADAPIPVTVLNGSFEDLVPEIQHLVGHSFAFYFIDPTGWKGLSLDKLRPLFENRNSEFLINFMYDHVNRFLEADGVAESISDFFGGSIPVIESGPGREDAILDLYRSRVRNCAHNLLVTSTRIQKPLDSRAYFHLVYATHHVKGLVEFKKVDERLAGEQRNVRALARDAHEKLMGAGQQSLFEQKVTVATANSRLPVEEKRIEKLAREALLRALPSLKAYADIQQALLQIPGVWEKDVRKVTLVARADGLLELPQLTGKKRVPMPDYAIVVKG